MSDGPKRTSAFVDRIRENTRRYLRDLNEENGMLHQKIQVLESDNFILERKLEAAQSDLESERSEREKLFRRLETLEQLRASSAEEYAVVEEQNNNLASLYSATYSLHGTLDRDRILGVIQEIVANLIGSEEMAVLEWDPAESVLRLACQTGLEPGRLETVSLDDGLIGHAVHRRRPYLADRRRDELPEATSDERDLSACIPLCIEDILVGAIVVFRLLPQKEGMEPIDYELYDLLGSQAAMALYSATLHARVANGAGDSLPGGAAG